MKKLIAILTILSLAAIVWAAQPTEVIKTVLLTTVPEQLGDGLSARTWVFVGCKAARTTNTSRVWICRNLTNDSAGIPLQPAQVISIQLPSNQEIKWWIDVETAGDGVTCLLIP
jgi:hypothetical protein